MTLPYYCPGGKKGLIKTVRFLGTVRSLFYQNTSSTRKIMKKQNKTKQKQKTRTLLLQRKYEKFSSGGNTDR